MEFKHFTEETVSFLENLGKNNNKEWFIKNKSVYETILLAQAKNFTETIGSKLLRIDPKITYSAKVNGSIFRLYKDARFSKGVPFKTHQGIVFWNGTNKLKSPSFYFQIEPPFYSVAVGVAVFTPNIIEEYRKSLQNIKDGKEIEKIIQEITKKGYVIGGKKRKNLPRGIAKGSANEELLKYHALYLSDETPINNDFYSDKFIDEIMKIYKDMSSFYKWILGIFERAKK